MLQSSLDVNSDWTYQPHPLRSWKQSIINHSEVSLAIDCYVDPMTLVIKFIVQSRVADATLSAFCDALKHSVQETADHLALIPRVRLPDPPKERKSSLSLNQRKSRLSHGVFGGAFGSSRTSTAPRITMRAKGSMRASRVVRTFQQSIVQNQYMFFIHPGGGDSAVYESLAQHLFAEGFNPKGIDNDVITSSKQYTAARDLAKLGKFYADMILASMKKAASNAPINILGWSLGGKIALETALVLEQRGHLDITVYLLDSFADLSCLGDAREVAEMISDAQLKAMPSALVDDDMIKKTKTMALDEQILSNQPLSGTLIHSRVTLFKAGMAQDFMEESELGETYGSELLDSYDNGFSEYVQNLTVIVLEDCDHGTIIEEEDEIIDVIKETTELANSRRNRREKRRSTLGGRLSHRSFNLH